ncbi:hypothetical protein CgunFtcFv8_009948 [Champsocephalus gunnari]|uniref:Uncharacterized protein n=1 Tax=Champsocephalus gunnari TaxID=52237 RepID=A0AAN8GZ67_CHAGU|nr:hypothetical protein CgunFtcFv8_009948 [Champsocephalus gunnari]
MVPEQDPVLRSGAPGSVGPASTDRWPGPRSSPKQSSRAADLKSVRASDSDFKREELDSSLSKVKPEEF